MSRWRPPAPHATPIITAEGLERLQRELDELWHRRRPAVVRALAAAAAEGDRSENAEYQYRKKELAGIDRRARYLTRRIPRLKVPPAGRRQGDKAYFGAFVELQAAGASDSRQWRIVGPDEADPSSGNISIDSPLARALLGHGVGEELQVDLPDGPQTWRLAAVHYPHEKQNKDS